MKHMREPHNGPRARVCTRAKTHAHMHVHTCIYKSVLGNVTFSQKPPFPALAPLPLWLCED